MTEVLPENENKDVSREDSTRTGKQLGTIVKDPVTGKFLPGHRAGGRPKGSKDFYTDFKQAIKLIRKKNGQSMTEEEFLASGLSNAMKGKSDLMKEIWDRVYGKQVQPNFNMNFDTVIGDEETLIKVHDAIGDVLPD